MLTTQTIITHWRPRLALAGALLTATFLARPQAPDANKTASDDAQHGNITGKVTAGKGISVVWVEAEPGMEIPKPAKVGAVSQKALRFEPHILAVAVGATVDFQNSDTVAHNIFWPAVSGNKKLGHSLGTWPKGQSRKFQFTTPGIVPLLCNVHPEMSAYVIVTPTPYFAETDDAGHFTIPNIPDRSYKLTAWHEGFKSQTKPVTVASDAKVEFTLTK